jgi:hypothetical protein
MLAWRMRSRCGITLPRPSRPTEGGYSIFRPSCAKYHHEESNRESLSRFIEKLKEKKQVEEEREQASEAAATFYR